MRVVHLGMVVHVVKQMRLVGDHAVDETHQQVGIGTVAGIGTLPMLVMVAGIGVVTGFQQPEMVGEHRQPAADRRAAGRFRRREARAFEAVDGIEIVRRGCADRQQGEL